MLDKVTLSIIQSFLIAEASSNAITERMSYEPTLRISVAISYHSPQQPCDIVGETHLRVVLGW